MNYSFASRNWFRLAISLFLPTLVFAGVHLSAQPQLPTQTHLSPQIQANFSDLGDHAAEQPAIGSLVSQGILRGVSPTQFNPDAPMTNGDFAASVQKMFNLPVPAQKVNFTDVPASSPIFNAVESITPFLGRQIVCFGCQLGSNFGPNAPASRLVTAVTIVNVLIAQKKVELMAPDAAEASLANVADEAQLQGPSRVYVATALQQGVLSLTADRAIAGLSPMTRANIAVQLDGVQKKFNVPLVRVP